MLGTLKKKIFGFGTPSKKRAKSRLHFVLVQDRTGLSAEHMGKFKEELMAVVQKYFVIDKAGFDIDYQRDSNSTTLVINSPVVVRRQEVPSRSLKGGSKSRRKRRREIAERAAPV